MNRVWIAGLLALCLAAPADAQVPDHAESAPETPADTTEVGDPDDHGDQAPASAAASFEEPYFPFLADEDPAASVSVGGTSGGFVVNARRLEETPTCGILPAHAGRDLSWGTAEMVGLVHEVADAVHAKHGTRLWVGNIGRRGGGDIEYSVSHDSGRDVDIALPYRDAKGPVDPHDYVRLDNTGHSTTKGWRFDAARAWTIVEALISSSAAQVQYVFVSGPLRKRILDHARANKVAARTIERATDVLRQPGGAAHDDHFHVRITCSARDVEAGCASTGLVHPWHDLHGAARDRRSEIAARALDAADGPERKRGIERLVLLGARDRISAIGARLDDDDREVRIAAAGALGRLRVIEEAERLVTRFSREDDLGVQAALLDAAARLTSARAGALLRDTIAAASLDVWTGALSFPALVAADAAPAPLHPALLLVPAAQPRDARSDALRLTAIEAASRSDRPEPVEALLPLLSHHDFELRAHAARALGRVTNVAYGIRWDDPAQDIKLRDAAAVAWQRFTGDSRRAARDTWLVAGFRAAGYRVPRIDAQHAWELVRALRGPEHVAYNAERVLVRLAELDVPLRGDTRKDVCRAYLRWFSARRGALRIERAPDATRRACERSEPAPGGRQHENEK